MLLMFLSLSYSKFQLVPILSDSNIPWFKFHNNSTLKFHHEMPISKAPNISISSGM